MLSNEELLEVLQKATLLTTTGGQASAEDVEEFVDLAVEQNAVLRAIRNETGITTSRNIDAMELGDPVSVAATEATAPDSADIVAPTISRTTLQPVGAIAAFDVSFDFLRKNIERERVNETLNRIFAKRLSKDVVIIAFSGDTSVAADTRLNKCKRIRDGFIKQAENDADVHDYTISGSDYLGTIFPAMLKLLPKDYRDQRDELAFFCSVDVWEDYGLQIGDRATALGDQFLIGNQPLKFRGVDVIPVYGMADNRILLTLKQNLVVGWGQEMTIGRDVYNRRRVVEVTITYEIDVKYIAGDAIVLGSGA